MAKSQNKEKGDGENTAFGLPKNLSDHKPGYDHRVSKPEIETEGDHRFRPSGKKDIPQGSLADRIGKSQKRK